MKPDSTAAGMRFSRSGRFVVALCFLVALLEGIDIQSMGVAAPLLSTELALNPSQTGMALSASLFGLLIGAVLGGLLSDRIGRRPVLMISAAALGVFSLATTVASDLNMLLVVRFLTGLGMGGAFPTLIAISGESVDEKYRSTAISLMYSGMPLGGTLAGAIASATIDVHGWRPVFYVGGLGPLLILPLLALLPSLKPSGADKEKRHATTMAEALWGEQRTGPTLLIWVSYFFTLLVVYLLLNWLPSLMVSKGFEKSEAAAFMMALNIGAALGSVTLGMLMDRWHRRLVAIGAYVGMASSLAALAGFDSYSGVMLASFAAGFFALGGQLVLYALTPMFYPPEARGTGIGAAVAVGRFGAIAGPLMAGQILQSGGGAPTVLTAAIPCLVIGAIAVRKLL
jgi:AAHS family 3-hydroxyphenylpropionic acid transporter